MIFGKFKTSLSTLLLMCISLFCYGQPIQENPDFFRSLGKFYVVIAVVLIVLLGLIAFLVYLDRKISSIEKEIKG